MRVQDFLVRTISTSLEDVIRAALAVPEDKRDWAPGGAARSTLAQMQEIAMSGAFFAPVLRDGKLPEMDDHARREMVRTRASFDTVEKCVEAARESTAEFCRLVADLTDDRLDEEVWLPMGGGMMLTMAEVAGKHAWNLAYHQGQINQIQLVLGDREMH